MKASARTLMAALLASSAFVGVSAATASAQTVLRLDEVPVGELDPAKASDYADSMLMFNVYDTLVLPKQGGVGYVPDLATGWKMDGNDYVFDLRDDVKFASGNPLTRRGRRLLVRPHEADRPGPVLPVQERGKRGGRGRPHRSLQTHEALRALHCLAGPPSDRRQEACDGASRRRRRRDEGLGPGLAVDARGRLRRLYGRLAQSAVRRP